MVTKKSKKSKKPKHDEIVKVAMENPRVAYDFLKTHLPKDVLAIIDISSLKVENASFIEPKLTRNDVFWLKPFQFSYMTSFMDCHAHVRSLAMTCR
ncbi:Rpn family recombination-promoting nuclease/putative transposase [Candidatus Tisiphia endosymbiont of Myopa tessellatipennis]|uniref:Rpn family recombination-promoting nuclease/putative transposase n=1 Tax=Candidatus Tisiphia endosymbiont of Myopa tessellatipennis TaxID=3066257 RepID=UPI00313DCAF3